VRYKEVGEGKLNMPEHPASLFSLSAQTGNWNPETNEVTGGRPLYVVYLPFATEASTRIPAPRQVGAPWRMFPGWRTRAVVLRWTALRIAPGPTIVRRDDPQDLPGWGWRPGPARQVGWSHAAASFSGPGFTVRRLPFAR